jgi:hypothetical protein
VQSVSQVAVVDIGFGLELEDPDTDVGANRGGVGAASLACGA